jgi:hypothetical protein
MTPRRKMLLGLSSSNSKGKQLSHLSKNKLENGSQTSRNLKCEEMVKLPLQEVRRSNEESKHDPFDIKSWVESSKSQHSKSSLKSARKVEIVKYDNVQNKRSRKILSRNVHSELFSIHDTGYASDCRFNKTVS